MDQKRIHSEELEKLDAIFAPLGLTFLEASAIMFVARLQTAIIMEELGHVHE